VADEFGQAEEAARGRGATEGDGEDEEL